MDAIHLYKEATAEDAQTALENKATHSIVLDHWSLSTWFTKSQYPTDEKPEWL